MKSARFTFAVLATCLGVAACSGDNSDADSGITDPVSSVTIEDTINVAVDDRDVTVVTEPFDTDYTPQLGYYIVSFDLESTAGQPNKDYNETSPAMPFVAEGLAIYLDNETYKFQLKHADGTSSDVMVGKTSEWTSLRLVNLPSGASLFIDGQAVLSGPRVRPMTKATIGKGYRNRLWTGRIRNYKACSVGERNTQQVENMTCADVE